MDKGHLQKWAHLAEIVSSIAVVVTLLFLVFEIRGNSNLIRAEAFDRNSQSLIELRMKIISDDESLAYMADYWGVESPEMLKRSLLILSLWSVYEKTYYAQQYDQIGPSEWQRFEYVICSNIERRPDYWETRVARFLTTDFRDYVAKTCNLD